MDKTTSENIAFWGTSENAADIQIFSVIIAYCLGAIMGYHLNNEHSTKEISQVLGKSIQDKTHINELYISIDYNDVNELAYNQLLFSQFKMVTMRKYIKLTQNNIN